MSRLHSLAINAEGFAFNPLSGECFRINPAGEAVVAALRNGRTCEDIAAELAAAHGEPYGRVLSDVLEFRSALARCRLID